MQKKETVEDVAYLTMTSHLWVNFPEDAEWLAVHNPVPKMLILKSNGRDLNYLLCHISDIYLVALNYFSIYYNNFSLEIYR